MCSLWIFQLESSIPFRALCGGGIFVRIRPRHHRPTVLVVYTILNSRMRLFCGGLGRIREVPASTRHNNEYSHNSKVYVMNKDISLALLSAPFRAAVKRCSRLSSGKCIVMAFSS